MFELDPEKAVDLDLFLDKTYEEESKHYERWNAISQELQSRLVSLLETIVVVPAGLQGCHLALKSECLNIHLSSSDGKTETSAQLLAKLCRNSQLAQQCGLTFCPHNEESSRLVRQAKFKYSGEQEPVDITLSVMCLDAETKALLDRFIQYQPNLLPTLAVAFQYWAKCVGFFEHNLLIPEALVVMAAHYLQQCVPPALPVINMGTTKDQVTEFTSSNRNSVGQHWMNMLNYYAISFDYQKCAVDLVSPSGHPAQRDSEAKHFNQRQLFVNTAHRDQNRRFNLAGLLKPVSMFDFFHARIIWAFHYFSTIIETKTEDILENCRVFPVVCRYCQNAGHNSKDCLLVVWPKAPELPEMTDLFLSYLNETVESVVIENTVDRDDMLEVLVDDFREAIIIKFPTSEIEIYGSSRNGFTGSNSDVDLCLTFHGQDDTDGVQRKQIIKDIATLLDRSNKFREIQGLPDIRVPLVRFTHCETKIEGEMCLYNKLALYNTRLLRTYASLDNRCRQLGLMAKHIFKQAGICSARERFLSSYAYILMVIYYLQHCQPPVLPCLQEMTDDNGQRHTRMVGGWDTWFFERSIEETRSAWSGYGKNSESIGSLWLGFLRFYTEQFDLDNEVVAIRKLEPLLKLEKSIDYHVLAIEDPFDLNHNLGSKVLATKYSDIMKVFIKVRKHFGTRVDSLPQYYKTWKLLDHCLKKILYLIMAMTP